MGRGREYSKGCSLFYLRGNFYFLVDRGGGLPYNIMMQLVWRPRPFGLGFDKIEVTF